jgi:hypothetical protein
MMENIISTFNRVSVLCKFLNIKGTSWIRDLYVDANETEFITPFKGTDRALGKYPLWIFL